MGFSSLTATEFPQAEAALYYREHQIKTPTTNKRVSKPVLTTGYLFKNHLEREQHTERWLPGINQASG